MAVAAAVPRGAELHAHFALAEAGSAAEATMSPSAAGGIVTRYGVPELQSLKRLLPELLDIHEEMGTGSCTVVYRCTVQASQEASQGVNNGTQAASPCGRGARPAGLRFRPPKLDLAAVQAALKILRDGKLDETREVQLLTKLKHPNLVKLYRAVEGPPSLLVLELCKGGTLAELVHRSGREDFLTLPTEKRVKPAGDVLNAVDYLHSMNVVHRDVQIENCFLSTTTLISASADMPQVKLGDLGHARESANELMTKCIGNIRSMAPEVFATDSYGKPADVFSWAILLHELAAASVPYSSLRLNDAGLIISVTKGVRPQKDDLTEDSHKEELWAALEASWAPEPQQRLSASELLQRWQRLI
eukprot:TRINITY_DN80133_c0_g1_i1.p1 TRINITY_DN80133_c0_g1~~TRINITY_DN80133_c0_g1_i1.p1  ORF type:complete len:394 (+),score=79.09 TRINITY_DN80133_c0_g1_i1:103-1182(+)